jgi:hypothetical protein
MPRRKVTFDKQCDADAEILGGYQRIDETLFGFLEALERDPRGFPKIETDWGSARYIRTKKHKDIPELIWGFCIDSNDDVTIVHVEIYEGY